MSGELTVSYEEARGDPDLRLVASELCASIAACEWEQDRLAHTLFELNHGRRSSPRAFVERAVRRKTREEFVGMWTGDGYSPVVVELAAYAWRMETDYWPRLVDLVTFLEERFLL